MTEELKRVEPVPERLGPYQLIRRLGAGGAGQVWLARNLTKGGIKLVALKVTPRSALGYGSRRRMFENEARMASLSHSNIVQVFDAIECEGRGVLVMEWVEGIDLAGLLERCRRANVQLSLELATYIVGEILAGLAYAHGLVDGGVVHRDISPHNVIVSISGEVKILDFGTARVGSEHSSGLHVVGKPRYMAPEQTMGDSRSPSVDLFSVGAILHELLEGKRFRAGAEGDELLARARAGAVSELTREVPPEIEQLHDGLLEPDPRRRIASADDAIAQLAAWADMRESSEELAALVRRFVEPHSSSALPPSTRGDETTIASAEQRSSSISRPVWPRWALLTFALCLVGGYVVLDGRLREDPGPNSHADSEPVSSIVLPISPEVTVESEVGAATLDESPTSAPDLGSPVASEPPAKAKPRVRTRRRASKSTSPRSGVASTGTVELFAHEYLYIQVEVAGQQIDLDPSAALDLPAGRHAVRFREPPSPWQHGGEIVVEANTVTQVRFKRPGAMGIRILAP